jgi:hypothetical protein
MRKKESKKRSKRGFISRPPRGGGGGPLVRCDVSDAVSSSCEPRRAFRNSRASATASGDWLGGIIIPLSLSLSTAGVSCGNMQHNNAVLRKCDFTKQNAMFFVTSQL